MAKDLGEREFCFGNAFSLADVATGTALGYLDQVLPDVNTLTRAAATQAYEQAGVGPEDLNLVELHDCFATAELIHYDNLMLCEPGGAVDLFESGATWRDGRLPVNVSGGLQSKGHPIGATGIANVWEVCQHRRGDAEGDRLWQIENVCGSGHDDTIAGNSDNNVFTGGGGNDTFVFANRIGHDTITDFDANGRDHDTLEIHGYFQNFEELREHAQNRGNDVVITLDDHNSITLEGVHLNQLHDYDFHFV